MEISFRTDNVIGLSMTEIVKESFELVFISFVLSMIFAPFMIGLLYKFGQVAAHKKEKLGSGIGGDNSLYLKIMNVSDKNGTPNMGGILIWMIVPLVTLIWIERSILRDIFILSFLSIGFWGFLDVLLTNTIRNDPSLKTLQEKFIVRSVRFLLAVTISSILMYLASDLYQQIDYTIFFVTIPLNIIGIIFFGFFSQFAIYSAEITDGLDGLMIGIFGIVYTALAILLTIQGQFEFLPYIGVIIGSILVDLYFNISPARFYNGGPSAMPLGFTAFLLAFLSNNIVPYMIISSMTWIIMLSSLVQIISIRFFKRRIFKIAPLHHHFQSLGWSETKVTMRFWLFTLIFAILGIYIGIIL